MTIRFYIEHIKGETPAWELRSDKNNIIIGRDNSCDIVIPDPNKHLSRKHIKLSVTDSECFLEVISKVNAVYLGGRELTYMQQIKLNNKEVINVIDFKVTIYFEDLQLKDNLDKSDEDPFAWLDSPVAESQDPLINISTDKNNSFSNPKDPFEGLFEFNSYNENNKSHLVGKLNDLPPLESNPLLDPIDILSRNKSGIDKISKNIKVPSKTDDALNRATDHISKDIISEILVKFTPDVPEGTPSLEHVHPIEQPFKKQFKDPSSDDKIKHSNLKNFQIDNNFNLIEIFLDEVGLANISMNNEEIKDFMRLAGQLTKISIVGIMRLLLARSEMKKEFSTQDRTRISSKNNNPLKVMATPDEALKFLLSPKTNSNDAFMPPLLAIQDAYDDVLAHEFALVSGMRAAVIGALKVFDPKRIEESVQKDSAYGILGSKKSKLWEKFETLYQQIELSNVDSLDKLFEKDFLESYQEQVKIFRNKSK